MSKAKYIVNVTKAYFETRRSVCFFWRRKTNESRAY